MTPQDDATDGNDTPGNEHSDFCDYCYRTVPQSDLSIIYTVINGLEKKERVCPDCGGEARQHGKPAATDGGAVESDKEAVIDFKCPMPGCSFTDTIRWPLSEFPDGLKGVSVGDTVEGPPFSCPECDENGVAHSDLFEVHGVLNTRSSDTGVDQ